MNSRKVKETEHQKEEEIRATEAQLFSEDNIKKLVQDLEDAWNAHDVNSILQHLARDVEVVYKGKSFRGIDYVRTDYLRNEEFNLTKIKYQILGHCIGKSRTRGVYENILKIALKWTLVYDRDTSGRVAIERVAGEEVSGFVELLCQRKKTTNTLEITFIASI